MLALYFFGPMVESYLGRRRFLAFYLLCGAAGAATYLVLWQLRLLEGGAQRRSSGRRPGSLAY